MIARGLYLGNPEAEFFCDAGGSVYFRHKWHDEVLWAGPDVEHFQRIAAAWNRYRSDVRACPTEAAQLEVVARMRTEFTELGALRDNSESLWSVLVWEAEQRLG
jgi:hypothetical protein